MPTHEEGPEDVLNDVFEGFPAAFRGVLAAFIESSNICVCMVSRSMADGLKGYIWGDLKNKKICWD